MPIGPSQRVSATTVAIVVLSLSAISGWEHAVVASAGANQTETRQARDARSVGEAPSVVTGQLQGTVSDGKTGARLRNVSVTLVGAAPSQRYQALTDTQGRYLFAHTPVGEYRLFANKVGYVPFLSVTGLAASRKVQITTDTAEAIDLVLVRGGAIVGYVVDEAGDPIPAVKVTAQRQAEGSGALITMGATSLTDDLGRYRVFGLPQGRYVVAAEAAPLPPDRTASSPSNSYLRTYYPGTVNVHQAQRVDVSPGQEASADLALATGVLTTLTGTVVGLPEGSTGNVFLEPAGPARDFAATSLANDSIDKGGQFVVSRVPPGNYRLMARIRSGRTSLFAERSVNIPDDAEGPIIMSAGPGGAVSGRMVWRGGTGAEMSRMLSVVGRPMTGSTLGTAFGRVQPDGAFDLSDVFGLVSLTVNGLSKGWYLESIEFNGVDITSLGLEAQAGARLRGVVINLSNAPAVVSGVVNRETGGGVAARQIVLVSQDRRLWRTLTNEVRGYYVTTLAADGQFRFDQVRPGRYFVVPVEAFDPSTVTDPDRDLAELSRGASEVLAEGGRSVTATMR